MAEQHPYDIQHIEPLLTAWLEVEFTFYAVDQLAREIAARPRIEQDFLLDWIRRIATTNREIAYRFALRAGELLTRLDWRLIEAWARQAMNTYDRSGLRPALLVIDHVDVYAKTDHAHVDGALYEDIDNILLTFARGLSGRSLKIAQNDTVYTDSATLYLPAVIAKMETLEDNFVLAKAMVAFMWAQTRFGSFRPGLAQRIAAHPQAERALQAFAFLETLRLEACLKQELPGLHREMQRLKVQLGQGELHPTWAALAQTLSTPTASVEDSLLLLDQACALDEIPHFCFQGELRLDAVMQVMEARIEHEKILLRIKLAELAEEARQAQSAASAPQSPPQFKLKQKNEDAPDLNDIELTLDGAPIAPPEGVKQLFTSIQLD